MSHMDRETAPKYKKLLLGIPGWNHSGTRQAFLQDVFWGQDLLNQIDNSAPGDRAATELVALIGGLDAVDADGLTPACVLLKAIRGKFGAGKQRGQLLAELEGLLCDATPPIRSVLMLAANPEDQELIRTDREYTAIKQSLNRPLKGKEIELRLPEFALSAARLIETLLAAEEPSIVHFSGHGGGAEGLYLEDAQGNSEPASAEALAAVFRQFAHCVQVVVLNACFSEPQAEAIVQHIDHVIGTRKDIGDDTATAFSAGFYEALVAGRSIEDAFQIGCAQIQMAGFSEHLIPVLRTRDGKVIPCA